MLKKEDIDNNLFNEKRMEEFIELYNDSLVIKSDNNPINTWIKKLENNELMDEKSNYITFFEIILNDLLGYTSKDIEFENNIGKEGHPVEFTLKKEDTDFVVVELKGTTYKDLTKRKNGRISPVEQASNYASAKKETKWAIVSNYDEFRLFSPTSRENYISFKFHELKNPKILKKFLLIFSKFSLITKNIPEILLKETKLIERNLEDEFYQLFSETRLMLIKELESNSNLDRLESIRISQLILNRYIFLCFAEDLNLIPPETTVDVLLTPIKHNNLSRYTMWNRLNELFIFSDEGNIEKGITNFNGGLFHEDLYGLKIRDKIDDYTFFNECYKKWSFTEKYKIIEKELGNYKNNLNPIYKNLLVISSFDFGSELDINILGHIFENSIGDIEELKDETNKRRKKDGVYYTPEYITDYICRNTIIPYLSISNETNDVHELIKEYEDINNLDLLDGKLKEIKIIDIACGSGAFLNKAVDVLFEIHEALHESKYIGDESLNRYFDSLDSRRQIISNNIYGVDLNDESVEITKLSLFLKLATTTGVKQGFMLPNLDKNIKCGNSLINDETLVGNKSFNWNIEFKEVIASGGFDIVIGNPPYVRADYQDDFYQKQRTFLKKSKDYETLYEKWDYYIAFIEKGLKLLKKTGYLSYIISNSYNTSKASKKSKEYIDNNYYLKQLDFFKNIEVFKGVGVESLIITVKNEKSDEFTKRILHEDTFENILILKDTDDLTKKYKTEDPLELDNYFNNTTLLGDICFISKGMVLNSDERTAKGEFKKDDLISEVKTEINTKPYVEGKNIRKYNVTKIRYLEWDTERIPHKVSRPTFPELYIYPKLIRSSTNQGIYDESGIITNHSCYIFVLYYSLKDVENRSINNSIKKWSDKSREELEEVSENFDIKYIQAIMNSNLCKYYLNTIRSSRIEYYTSPDELKLMPIKNISSDEQKEYALYVEDISNANKELSNEVNSFKKWLLRTYDINKLSNKIENYYELEFDGFLKEIKKKKVNVKQRKTQELLENEFNNSINIIKPLQKQINELDERINQMVYKLYDLTRDEIKSIEDSLK